MANVIQTASNRFSKGLVLDFSPENTSSESLSHALNATFLTFNGNEQSLQNDMGNARVETAYLPEGYIPVGTCEYGGIIYIVSYNPLEDKSLIGCFPSPERNISSEELGKSSVQINADTFQKFENGQATGELIHTSFNALLKDDKLNPGDKFLISVSDITDEAIKDLETNSILKDNPMIALNVVSIEDSGKVVYLNSELRKYEHEINDKEYKYHMVMKQASGEEGSTAKHVDPTANDIDTFRSILSSGYNVFKSKTSGKLAILAELITIDSYSVTHSIVPSKLEGEFDVVIHTEVSPSITDKNYLTVPKLKYYYLDKSLGYLSVFNLSGSEEQVELYTKQWNEIIPNTNFFRKLSDIYVETNGTKNLEGIVLELNQFLFPKAHSYHLNADNNSAMTGTYYTEFIKGLNYRILVSQIYGYDATEDVKKLRLNFFQERFDFYKEVDGVIPTLQIINDFSELNNLTYIYLKPFKTIYISNKDFLCSLYDNRIWNPLKNASLWDKPRLYDQIPTFLAGNSEEDLEYPDVNLASLKMPDVLYENGIDLPFKYDYTIVPCMRFGRLDHLAVSNTVDFGKLHAFNKSNFNTWKYHIDGNQLRLTFGAEIFDTFEENKVDALILEFYDHRGFAGSLEINNKKSYSGIFTKIITLNSYNELSKLKIDTEDSIYHSEYKHNANITKQNDKYYFKDSDVKYNGEKEGWSIKSEDNDCGVLYSNLIYGVKPYLRVSSQSGYTFHPKKEMVLFTFPIYNDHFYSVLDFNQLTNPKLSFVITHRLQDSGKPPKPYDDPDGIIKQGYDVSDLQLATKYLSGLYKDTSNISLVKYYEYAGESKLSLEIGLQENYLSWNLRNDPSINKEFSCTLSLIGKSEDESILILSNTNVSDVESLNYKTYDLNSKNKLGFDNNSNTLNIIKGEFEKYNFLNEIMSQIPIYYSFKIGYKVSISNIAKTQVPATTICALYHKKPDGKMNLSDFGLYEYTDNGNTYYLNDPIFYNGGSSSEELFGVGRINTYASRYDDGSAKNIFEQTTLYDINTTAAKELTIPGQLNTQALKEYKHLIGKLAFGLPHTHVIDTLYGVNISPNDTGWGIYSEWGNWSIESGDRDDTYGIMPDYNDKYLTSLYITPLYNLCINTKESINNDTNFISTLDFQQIKGRQKGYDFDLNDVEGEETNKSLRKYTGFSTEQVSWFNNQLLVSMKNIYAYNPDYDFLELQKGDVSLQNYSPSFTTNLVASKAKLGDENNNIDINDYIYLGPIPISNYVADLEKFCPTLNSSLILFTADLKGCGSEEYSLISSLTYNTQIPQAMVDDLTMDTSAKIVVKHSDGTLQFITGEFNKTALYGYTDELNPGVGNLVELDVANYKIYDLSTAPKTALLEINTDKLYWDVGEDRTLPINTLNYYANLVYTTKIGYKLDIFNDVYVKLICRDLINNNTHSLIQDTKNIYNFYLIVNNQDDIKEFNLNLNFDFTNNEDLYKADSINAKIRIYAQPLKVNSITIGALFESYESLSLSPLNSLFDKSKNTTFTYIYLNKEYTLNTQGTDGIQGDGYLIVNNNKLDICIYEGYTKDIKSWSIRSFEGDESIQCVLYRILLLDANDINYIGYAKKDWSLEPFFIHTEKTKDYSVIHNRRYFVKDEYSSAQFRGSTITINDLEYDPNPNGHRLFLKLSKYTYDEASPRGLIYYRKIKDEKNTWRYSKTKNLNHLFIYTGPCYKIENLDGKTELIPKP